MVSWRVTGNIVIRRSLCPVRVERFSAQRGGQPAPCARICARKEEQSRYDCIAVDASAASPQELNREDFPVMRLPRAAYRPPGGILEDLAN